jgi:glycosyltransferase involved in cell wall biosynthesis
MPANNQSSNCDPRITVVMATYNGSHFVAAAVDSILSQTFKNFEFIIIDDGSHDNTVDILSSYDDPRIRIIQNDKNRGTSYSRNLGISQAKGFYVASMDQDDISHPDRLQKQLTFMEENPRVGICGTWARTFGARQEIIKAPIGKNLIKASLFFDCPFIHPSIIFRRELLVSKNIYYNNVVAEDYDLWVRLMDTCEFYNLPEALIDYRIHPGQITYFSKEKVSISAMEIRHSQASRLLATTLSERQRYCMEILFNPAFKSALKIDLVLFVVVLIRKNRLLHIYPEPDFSNLLYNRLIDHLKMGVMCSRLSLIWFVIINIPLLIQTFGFRKSRKIYKYCRKNRRPTNEPG